MFETKAYVYTMCICLTTAFDGQSVIECGEEQKNIEGEKREGR